MNLQQFLARQEVSLTLSNDYGESVYLGEASTVKPQKDGYFLRFSGTLEESISPYTKAILHNGRKILSIVLIKPVRVGGTKAIDLVL